MKTKNILIIIGGVVVLAGLIVGASVLYKKLSGKAAPENVVEYQTTAESGGQVSGEAASGESGETTTEPEFETGGNPAKDFSMEDGEGNEVFLSGFLDKPIVLNFWASWCPPCREEMPDFQEMYEQYGDKVNFIFVNLTDGDQETRESAAAFIEEQGFTFPVYYDVSGEGAERYEIYYIPDTYFINVKGQIVSYAVGQIDRAAMEESIGKLME